MVIPKLVCYVARRAGCACPNIFIHDMLFSGNALLSLVVGVSSNFCDAHAAEVLHEGVSVVVVRQNKKNNPKKQH
jgi:hypothetical protein